MTGASAGGQTIIIKRVKKVSGGGHHGGAWKVAYADFVTAMMAFFLLMWLLNATTEQQRKGLADYFNPSIPISKVSGGGSGALNGSSVLSEDALIRDGAGATRDYPRTLPENDSAENDAEEGDLAALEKVLNEVGEEAFEPEIAEHIQTRMTPDGLLVELVDVDGTPLFTLGSPTPAPILSVLLDTIGPILSTVENDIAIIGHTDSLGFAGDNYSNWELSTDRAHAARRQLIKSGVGDSHIVEISGKADVDPISDDPLAPQNRRIAILLLNESARR